MTNTIVNADVIKAYNSSRKRVTKRVEFYEHDGETLWRPDETSRQAIEGSVSVDGSRDERRTLSLKIYNKDGVFDNSTDGFWYDKIIKVYRGIKYTDSLTGEPETFEYKLGEFMIDNISADINSPVVDVTCRDYSKRLMLDEFDQPTSFNEGSNLDELVRTIALNGGTRKFNLNTGNIIINAVAAFEAETPRWEAIKEICKPHGVEVYFNHDGQLETRPFKDVSTAAVPDVILNAGGGNTPANLVSASRSSTDSQVFNTVRVYATGEQGSVVGARFVAVRSNTDPESPTSIERIGRRPTSYSSDLFTSQQQVDDYADGFLAVSMLQDFSLSFESVVYPWIEANDIIQVVERRGDVIGPARYLLGEFSIPIGLGSMSGSGKRITKVGHVDNIQEN